MDRFLNKFINEMLFSENYEGIMIKDIENVEEAQLLFKKGDKFDHYVVILHEDNLKDFITFRDVIHHNTERVPEIIYLIVGDENNRIARSFFQRVIDLDIASVVYMDATTGVCTNLHKCSLNIYRDIQRATLISLKFTKGGFEGIKNKIMKNTFTFALALINVVIHGIIVWDSGGLTRGVLSSQLFIKGVLLPKESMGNQFYRMITSGFLHWDLRHLMSNIIGVIVIGIIIEDVYGKTKFSIIYLTAIICGSVMSLIFLPEVYSAGASGGVFGLLGAELAFGIVMRKRLGKSYLNRLLRGVILMIVVGMLSPKVNNVAHVAGLLGGMMVGLVLKPKKEIMKRL